MTWSFEYIKDNGGMELDSDYPYVAADGACQFNPFQPLYTISGYVNVQSGSESALMTALKTVGPISVGIDASSMLFQLYTGGVFSYFFCSRSSLNHAVLLIGYGMCDLIIMYLDSYWLSGDGQSAHAMFEMKGRTTGRRTGCCRTSGARTGASTG